MFIDKFTIAYAREFINDRIVIEAETFLDDGDDLDATATHIIARLRAQVDAAETARTGEPPAIPRREYSEYYTRNPQPAGPPPVEKYAAVIRVQRDVTQNSGTPMWRMTTDEGDTVNVFFHDNPAKNNYPLISAAGYDDPFKAMQPGDADGWTQHPILATIRRDGKGWELRHVEPRQPDSVPDSAIYLAALEALKNDPFALPDDEPAINAALSQARRMADEAAEAAAHVAADEAAEAAARAEAAADLAADLETIKRLRAGLDPFALPDDDDDRTA